MKKAGVLLVKGWGAANMDVFTGLVVTLAAILIVVITLYLCLLFMTKMLPKVGLLIGSILLTFLTVLFDIKYMTVAASAFSVAAVYDPAGWSLYAYVICGYVFIVSFLLMINFVTDGFGYNIFDVGAEKTETASYDEKTREFVRSFLYQLKYYTGLYALIGAFLSLAMIININFLTNPHFLNAGYEASFNDAILAAGDRTIEASPFALAWKSRFEAILDNADPWVKWVIGMYQLNVWGLMLGLVTHLLNRQKLTPKELIRRNG